MRVLLCSVLVILSFAMAGEILAVVPTGQIDPAYRPRFGVKAGFITGGFEAEGLAYDLATKYDVGIFFDVPTLRGVLLSPGVDIIGIKPDDRRVDESKTMIHPNISLKYILANERRSYAFRPGINVGYGFLTAWGPLDDSQYLTVTFLGELVFYVDGRSGILFEFGYFTASGGDDTYDLESDGIMVIRAGFLF